MDKELLCFGFSGVDNTMSGKSKLRPRLSFPVPGDGFIQLGVAISNCKLVAGSAMVRVQNVVAVALTANQFDAATIASHANRASLSMP